jgi:hypothetical protein
MLYRTFIVFAMLFGLSGCGPIYSIHYDFYSPHSWQGRQCANDCLANKTTCNMQCAANYQNCLNAARLTALPSYLAYVDERKKAGKEIDRTLADFADYSGCYQSCGCEENYRQCFTNCGGKVIEQRQCVAFCGQ